jgi:hypothetical protein
MSEGYFLSQDGSCHWYVVPAEKRAEWDAWRNIPEEDERSWEAPAFARRVDGPHAVVFTFPGDVA